MAETRLEILTEFLERNRYTSLPPGEVYNALRGVSDLLNMRSQMYLDRLSDTEPGSRESEAMQQAAESAAAQFLAYEEVIYVFLRLVELADNIEAEEMGYDIEPARADEDDGGPN